VCAENQNTDVIISDEVRNDQMVVTFKKKPLEQVALESRVNKTRWLDYSLSASVMVVVVSSLCGVTDVFVLSLQALLQFLLLDYASAVEVALARQRSGVDTGALLSFLYALYFVPLVASVCAIEVDPNSPAAPLIVVVVTSLHFAAGAIVLYRSARTGPSKAGGGAARATDYIRRRYQDNVNAFADVCIIVGLAVASSAVHAGADDDTNYSAKVATSIVFATIGNTFCLYGNFKSISSNFFSTAPFLSGSATSTFALLCVVFAFMWSPTSKFRWAHCTLAPTLTAGGGGGRSFRLCKRVGKERRPTTTRRDHHRCDCDYFALFGVCGVFLYDKRAAAGVARHVRSWLHRIVLCNKGNIFRPAHVAPAYL
jgi:hypothetical protein